MPQDNSYPGEWFPKVTKAKAAATRKQIFEELEQLPTGVIAEALAAAKANAAGNPLTRDPGSHGEDTGTPMTTGGAKA